ncbi:DUF2218 domain-containing protein [Demequina pelophila]|uniref:DUF2218 domain-containing protein n=1 Tax=Demequina pelophila TaxID=1638984 RepID=UPI000785EEB6|nr:DUF2218 domain-containing protein [Demequina pelophila]
MPLSVTGRARTDRPARYGKQLCSHLSRKIEASFDPEAGAGIVRREGTVATLVATDASLEITVSGEGEADVFPLMGIVQNHLEKFGAGDGLACAWDDAELDARYQVKRREAMARREAEREAEQAAAGSAGAATETPR